MLQHTFRFCHTALLIHGEFLFRFFLALLYSFLISLAASFYKQILSEIIKTTKSIDFICLRINFSYICCQLQ